MAGAILFALASPLHAQTSKKTPKVIALETVTITADDAPTSGPDLDRASTAGSHLGLTSFQTPASVDVVQGKALQRSNPTDINRALVENSVGLSYSGGHGGGGTAIGMRGFSGQNSITRLYDGVRLLPASGSVSFPFDSWTIDRVEVLHGPAAVLYGAGGIGGAINFVPKKPLTDSTRQEARIAYGSNNSFGLAWGSAGPINDRLAYSFDANATRSDGERDGNDSRSVALAGALQWQATDTLSITTSLDYGDQQPDNYFGTPLVDGKIDERLRWVNYNATDSKIRYRDGIGQIKAEWAAADGLTVRNTLYHVYSNRYWKNIEGVRYNSDTDLVERSSYIAVRHHHQQWGNRLEAVLDGQMGSVDHRTTVGIDLTRIRFSNRNNSPYVTPPDANPDVDPFNPDRGWFGTHTMATTSATTTKRASLFADSRLTFSDQFSLVAGVNIDRTEHENTISNLDGGFNSANGRLGAVWNPTTDIAVYGQLSYAEEALGNLLTLSATNLKQSLTTGKQAEVGVKLYLPDQRGEATLSVYHIQQKNILSSDPDDRSKTIQIGQKSSSGIEAAMAYDLGAGVTLHANAAWNKAKYDDFQKNTGSASAPVIEDYSGNRVTNAPHRIANLQASWDVDDRWQLRGGLHYVSAAYTNDANTVSRPSYTVMNAGVQWRATDRAVLDLTVTNLTDKVYANGGGSTKLNLAPGRQAMLSLQMGF